MVGDWLSRVRISGPTRLAFHLEEKDRVKPITLAFLTEWNNFALAVNQRALPRDASLRDQLQERAQAFEHGAQRCAHVADDRERRRIGKRPARNARVHVDMHEALGC